MIPSERRRNEVLQFFHSQLSIYRILVCVGQLISIFLLSVIATIVLRYLCLPSSSRFMAELQFTYTTCDDQLSGVCSYPTAVIDLEEEGWALEHDVVYDSKIDLLLSEWSEVERLGLYQILLQSSDVNGKVISNVKRAVLFKKAAEKRWTRQIFEMGRNVLFFPVYLFGYFDEESDRNVRISLPLVVKDTNVAFIMIQLQDKFAQVQYGTLSLSAKIGSFRQFLLDWPILSFFLMLSICFSSSFSILFLSWAYRGTLHYLNVQRHFVERRTDVTAKSELRKNSPLDATHSLDLKEAKVKQIEPSAPDLPVDIHTDAKSTGWDDEVPECPLLNDIPGWDVKPADCTLRHRSRLGIMDYRNSK
ncbi:hypothetical protein AB6A40_002779 [Gnathostoma spinigerum]|uniref:Seipin n=1 Tax=Gnathostoma spinigerum TaxID=75299 RepID=A0ABD6E7K2_9BILA